MISHLPYAAAARALAAALAIAGLAACGDRLSDTRAKVPQPDKASPSAVVIGQAPAEPTGDPPGTTPVAGNTTEVGKPVEANSKPQEGDSNSHSTLAPTTPQKANGDNTDSQGKAQ
jgi:hypothetical protein